MSSDSCGTRETLVFIDDPNVRITNDRLRQFFSKIGVDLRGIYQVLSPTPDRLCPLLACEGCRYSMVILFFADAPEQIPPGVVETLEPVGTPVRAFRILPSGIKEIPIGREDPQSKP